MDQSQGLIDQPPTPWTKPALLQTRVLMCFLYWQQYSMTAKRRGGGGQRGARGANSRFRAQAGQGCPFNLVQGPAERIIKLRAMKTEQTAKTMPFCLPHSQPNQFFFSIILFHFLAKEQQEKRSTRDSLAQVDRGKGRKSRRRSNEQRSVPLHRNAMWAEIGR